MKPNTVGQECGRIAAKSCGESDKSSQDMAGLLADSVILTLAGEKRVGDLAVGDRVITRDSGTATVTGLATREALTRAIHIRAGSLGHTRPDRDVTLPAGQSILIRDWRAKALFGTRQALVPAGRLIDGEFITETAELALSLVEIEFDRPHVVYVDGLEVASLGAATRAAKAA